MSSFKRIVITGGPHAGKTSVIHTLEKKFRLPYVFTKEAATQVLDDGWPKRELLDQSDSVALAKWQFEFQHEVFTMQLRINRNAQAIAHQGRFKAVVYDRDGQHEGAAYWPDGFNAYEKEFGVCLADTEAEFDLIIFLETLAVTQPAMFGTANNEHRYESSPEEAVAVNNRLYELYCRHPNFKFLPSGLALREKERAANMWIAQLMHPNQKK